MLSFKSVAPAVAGMLRVARPASPPRFHKLAYNSPFARPATGPGAFMAQTGELIRLVNYVDDILTTLRRIRA